MLFVILRTETELPVSFKTARKYFHAHFTFYTQHIQRFKLGKWI